MKMKMIALAGVAALALSGPAVASDAHGWYLGLGVGWDRMGSFVDRDDDVNYSLQTSDTALFVCSVGYRFADRIRLEGEVGYDRHGIKSDSGGGHIAITSFLLNATYDTKLSQKWDLTLGGGVGVGNVDAADSYHFDGSKRGFMWQAIGGFAYSINDNLDLTLDYRYREVSVNRDFPCGDCDTARLKNINEQVAMVGIRWYPWYREEAPPPPPPTPPPPPPPPVKTFIVFFDFNKSNLTADAEGIVSDAVKAAKAGGFVKVLITGHTDTVGSHSYNQGLSERRAETVKDDMVRQGMDGSQISTVGKSFDDPLVPTGPGVREPQNRRAVIQLGDNAGM